MIWVATPLLTSMLTRYYPHTSIAEVSFTNSNVSAIFNINMQ